MSFQKILITSLSLVLFNGCFTPDFNSVAPMLHGLKNPTFDNHISMDHLFFNTIQEPQPLKEAVFHCRNSVTMGNYYRRLQTNRIQHHNSFCLCTVWGGGGEEFDAIHLSVRKQTLQGNKSFSCLNCFWHFSNTILYQMNHFYSMGVCNRNLGVVFNWFMVLENDSLF